MKLFLIILLTVTLSFGSTVRKIKVTTSKLKKISVSSKIMNKNLVKISNKINRTKDDIVFLNREISKLSSDVKSKKGLHSQNINQLSVLKKELKKLNHKFIIVHNRLVLFVANNVYLDNYVDSKIKPSKEAFIKRVVVVQYKQVIDAEVKNYNILLQNIKNEIMAKNGKIRVLSSSINRIESKRDRILRNKQSKKILQKQLKSQLALYKSKIDSINREKSALNKTLISLNIIRKREINKHHKRSKAHSSRKSRVSLEYGNNGLESVSNVVRYKGAKTIAPFDRYTIILPFGALIDPQYHKRLAGGPNLSVVLESKGSRNVRAIFDGEVVISKYLNRSQGYVVQLKHKNSMNTTYMKLTAVAANIRKGVRLRRGTIIGRSGNNGLALAITQKNNIIDPMQVISRSR